MRVGMTRQKWFCDFFNQIAVPASKKDFDFFLTEISSLFDNKDELVWRSKLLFPAYQIKWCCIVLNILLPVNLQRRIFANDNINLEHLKFMQLEKAEKILINLGSY